MSEIIITSPDKILFPKEKITKLDVINYYASVANLMLPYIKGRLLAVIRCHGGVNGEKFFKKHPTTDKGGYKSYTLGGEEYFYLTTAEEIVIQAQNGTIEFHPWGSKVSKIEAPDMMVFDLDPDEKLTLNKLRKGVIYVKEILEELGLSPWLKTSGGKGYHIMVQLKKKMGWEEFYAFSKNVALVAESRHPSVFTTNIKKAERKGKIFLDYLRNNRGSTCVCPYSLRAREGAPISMPIAWDMLFKVKPSEVNIKNYKKFC